MTSKALTGMNMNSRQDVLEGSDDESFDDSCEGEHYEEDDVDPVGLHNADPVQRGTSIAKLQAAMDNELVGKACDLRAVSSGPPVSSRGGNSLTMMTLRQSSNLLISTQIYWKISWSQYALSMAKLDLRVLCLVYSKSHPL